MIAGSAFLLFLSAQLCCASLLDVSTGGVWIFLGCALLCLLFSLLVPFLPVQQPKWFGLFFALAFFLRLLPLWPSLLPELGTVRTPIFFALMLAIIGWLAVGGKELLPRAALLLSLLAVLCCIFCLTGDFAVSLFPEQEGSDVLFGAWVDAALPFLCMLFCPLSAALLLPSVGEKHGGTQLRILVPAAVAATVCALPVWLFAARFWECGALLFSCPLCAAAELRVLGGRRA